MTIKAKDTLNPVCYYDFCEGAYEYYLAHTFGKDVSVCPYKEGGDKWKGWHHARLSKELQLELQEKLA
jgi:hypothetical protein